MTTPREEVKIPLNRVIHDGDGREVILLSYAIGLLAAEIEKRQRTEAVAKRAAWAEAALIDLAKMINENVEARQRERVDIEARIARLEAVVAAGTKMMNLAISVGPHNNRAKLSQLVAAINEYGRLAGLEGKG